MKHSTLIKRAKVKLAHSDKEIWWPYEKTVFVCIAIMDAGIELNQTEKAEEIVKLISQRLGNYDTVYDWLYDLLAPDAREGLYDDDILQAYRLRWMDKLASEYKEAGK